jgi:glycosyltransferase involved in cell wall biosynthesis
VTFSVVIPLYNKEAEIERAIRSTLAQTIAPLEVVVVDDGSTDGSASLVERIIAERAAADNPVAHHGEGGDHAPESADDETNGKADLSSRPTIRLVRQRNAGETAARNRGMAEAAGTHFALLDADDEWRPDFLATVAGLIERYPAAGLYCTGFDVERRGTLTAGRTPAREGEVDFFAEAMTRFVATASSTVLPRRTVERVGGFPDGMRLGGDQYMWAKVALGSPVVFTPRRCAVMYASASNRSAATYTPETTPYSFRDFIDLNPHTLSKLTESVQHALGELTETERSAVGEFAARVALGKAISATVRPGGGTEGRAAERDFAYNRLSRRLWWRLWLLNRLPAAWRAPLNGLYLHLAWILARKGF